MKAKIALIDDHTLLRTGLANLLKDLGYDVVMEADNGVDFMEKLKPAVLPDVVVMDINMPRMDSYDTTQWLKVNHPTVRVLALSMFDDENAVIRMLRSGAKGYILKDSEPAELESAIRSLLLKGFYHSELVTGKLIHTINFLDEPQHSSVKTVLGLTERELEFLKLACTEMTYKEIANQMHLSPRTIDGYRDDLFEKLNLKSRVGLVLFAIKTGITKV